MRKNDWKSNILPALLTIVLVMFAGAGTYLLASGKGAALVFGASQKGMAVGGTGVSGRIPELDKNLPENLETALFALG